MSPKVRVFLRRRRGRRQQGDEKSPRRQGRQPGRNGRHRPARSSRASPSRPRFATSFTRTRKRIPEAVRPRSRRTSRKLEKAVGQGFGDPKNPLLVSIRSGARASMPGMMDTILNLGLNEKTVAALIAKTGNSAVRLRLLPPLRPDVRRRRPRPEAGQQGRHRSVRSHHRSRRSTSAASRATPT